MIIIPGECDRGAQAALAGTRMATVAWPLGFTFCPHTHGTPQWHNFISGAVHVYFADDTPPAGEASRWVKP